MSTLSIKYTNACRFDIVIRPSINLNILDMIEPILDCKGHGGNPADTNTVKSAKYSNNESLYIDRL